MSYHGFIPLCKKHLSAITTRPPTLLEVGVDRGVSFLSLATFLARSKQEFTALGIDIMIQEQVQIMLHHLDLLPSQQAYLLEENSLTALPKLKQMKMKFDVLLLDGDHNYHTVSQELLTVPDLVAPDGILIIDDYDGRWSEKDLWYAERPGYEQNANASKKIETDKHGVKAAVDEFIATNPQWRLSKPVMGEPVLLSRK